MQDWHKTHLTVPAHSSQLAQRYQAITKHVSVGLTQHCKHHTRCLSRVPPADLALHQCCELIKSHLFVGRKSNVYTPELGWCVRAMIYVSTSLIEYTHAVLNVTVCHSICAHSFGLSRV